METNLKTGDINKTLLKLSLPLIISALVTVCYNFVDILFLGRLGTEVVAGVGIAFFIFWLAASLSLIPKVGMGVYASRAFGSDNRKETVRVIHNGFVLALAMGTFYVMILFIIRNRFIDSFALGDVASAYGKKYMFYSTFGIIFFVINPVITQAFIAIGDSITPFKFNTLGALINIIIDPIAIFGIGPFKGFGVVGAALASGIGQLVVFTCFMITIYRRDGIIREAISRHDLRIHWIIDIIKLGLPASLLSGFLYFIMIVLNGYTARFGDLAVAVTTIGRQIETITLTTSEGIQVGIQALVGQSYGSGNKERIKQSVKASLRLVFCFGLIAGILMFIFRYQIIHIFVPGDTETIMLGAKYLLIASIGQVFISTEVGSAGIFNGLIDSKTPAAVGVIFNFLRIPLSLLLMHQFGVMGIWLSITSTAIIKGILSVILLRKKLNKMF